jgi:hypothetical protein
MGARWTHTFESMVGSPIMGNEEVGKNSMGYEEPRESRPNRGRGWREGEGDAQYRPVPRGESEKRAEPPN